MKVRSSLWILAVVVALVAVGLPAVAADHAYVGSKKCKMCHIKEYNSWAETKMAKAFDLLLPGERSEAALKAGFAADKDYSKDPTCLPCHVTGYGKAGGFVDMATTPDLAGVGCESCHGPGGTYLEPQYMSLKNKEYKKADLVAVGLVDTVSEKQCTTCHNSKSPFVADDYKFDFAANKAKGAHESFPLKYTH